NALKTVVIPGEIMQVKILRAGEESQQGIGYLDDGTMVVVEDARNRQGETISMTVTSSLQTSAGRMIFGKYERTLSGAKSGGTGNNSNNQNRRPQQTQQVES
ncbi:MAG: hypothetical protein PHU23_19755, partial [Dehalococcoidales bacterium]|nr:hypothetical protein [Dehalococcoidales bacterium]